MTSGSNHEDGKKASRGQARRQIEWHRVQQQQSRDPGHHRHVNEDGRDEYRSSTTQVPQTQRLIEILDEAQREESCRHTTKPQQQQQKKKKKKTAKKTVQVDNDLTFQYEFSESSEDWEEVAREAPMPGQSASGSSPPPSYDFPGTWSAAAHDSAHALTQVKHATLSYASALAASGMGKASWNIGTAALSSTNHYALSLAGWVMAKTGATTNKLPCPLRNCISSREEAAAAKERRRRQRICHGVPVPVRFEDEHGVYMLDMHEMDDDETFLGNGSKGVAEKKKSGWEEQKLGHGKAVSLTTTRENGEEEKVGDGLLSVFEFDD